MTGNASSARRRQLPAGMWPSCGGAAGAELERVGGGAQRGAFFSYFINAPLYGGHAMHAAVDGSALRFSERGDTDSRECPVA